MIIGIDASNIRAGGGLTHLSELLSCVNIENHRFEKIIVWASDLTLNKLEDRAWLIKRSHKWLNRGAMQRMLWRKLIFGREVQKNCDVLFIPGATNVNFSPNVSMCQNLLPFDEIEKKRFGYSLSRFRYEILRMRQCKSFKRSDGIIFLSKESVDKVSQSCKGIKNTYTIIPHGVSDMFRNSTSKRNNGGTIKLLYVSILNLYKHQWNVVHAVHELLDQNYDIELKLVGPYYQPAKVLVEEAINNRPEYRDRITWLPLIEYGQLPTTYSESDIFVFASTCETFGLILLEAMASGLPIVCSERSSMKEVLSDGGLYFDPLDPATLVNQASRYLDDTSLRMNYAKKAKERAGMYCWEKTSLETFNFIESVYLARSQDISAKFSYRFGR